MLKSFVFSDFDGMLIRSDSIVKLTFYAVRKGLASPFSLLSSGVMAGLYLLGAVDAKRSKQAALRFLRGKTVEEMRDFSREFCRDVLIPRLYAQGVAELNKRHDEGCEVWLVSASPAFYLEPLMDALPLAGVVGTRMHTDENGVYTGEMAGENCRGFEKPLRLAEVLAARGDLVDYAASWAYGDTAGDAPMLALCANKVAVNPKRKLMKALEGADGVTAVRWK